MTATKQMIKDGIAGGWTIQDWNIDPKSLLTEKWRVDKYYDFETWECFGDVPCWESRFSAYQALLDPLFFKAVGVTRGWGKKKVGTFPNQVWEMDYKAKQHQFLTHLQSGKTIEDSLEAIK